MIILYFQNCVGGLSPERGFIENEPKTKTWKEIEGNTCVPLYQTGSISEETMTPSSRNSEENYFAFTVGTDTCETNSYCNGPLRAGRIFVLTMRVFTSRGWTDTDYITIKTENEVPLMLISISILSVMLIVFVAGFYISYRKTRTLK
jgi:TM proximal of protein tyrosine phosphatase, receptor type J